MLNISTLEDALYDWVFGVTALPTIHAHPNADRPSTAYNLINIVQSTPQGIADYELTAGASDTVDIDYSNLEELFVTINTYYDNALQTATKIKDSLARVTVTDALFAGGLGYLRATSVQDVPEVINKQWEQRGQFDCFFSVRSLDEENIETIQKIEITNNINDDGDTVTIEKP